MTFKGAAATRRQVLASTAAVARAAGFAPLVFAQEKVQLNFWT